MADKTVFYKASEAPIKTYGLMHNGNYYHRIPIKVAENTNDGVKSLNCNTAGGRVRFITDSPFITVKATLNGQGKMEHFALTGSAGFDVYTGIKENCRFAGTFFPHFDNETIEATVYFEFPSLNVITVNFPTYSGVKELLIGIKEDAVIQEAPDYTYPLPVVFYGSSITQGGCASRPGNSYQAILSRRLDFDYINLGFSGSAKAETAITEYMQGLSMCAFVLDYDHNAPSVEHLQSTHEKLFQAIRKAHPDLPILMLTRPKVHLTPDEVQRKAVVEATYLHALDNGDKNVYFIPGDLLISPDCIESATVDNCHPNDAGFLSMANTIQPVLNRILHTTQTPLPLLWA